MPLKRYAACMRMVVLLLTGAAAIAAERPVVNDVTQLNPIMVERIVVPTRLEHIVDAVRSHPGPVSIGGARYSMGGQTATEHSLHLDMRQFDRVLRFAPQDKEITVQTGITWRQIQEVIDPHDLSLQVMQSYANFTVGGSLSVNAHGRYIGHGPIVSTVKLIRMVLADGRAVTASPEHNPDLFYGAIGGYGGLGVIVEATLRLADNVRVERRTRVMPLAEYRRYFEKHIASGDVIFHNAILYPERFDTVRSVSYAATARAVTEPRRLIPPERNYGIDRTLLRVTSDLPFGKTLRRRILEPLYFSFDAVEWRNYQASYDVKSLEPLSEPDAIFALQEYFVPVGQLERFAGQLRQTFARHGVNVVNVSIRHARKDPGTLLAWAREDVFAFVIYYKQGKTGRDQEAVRQWTRELIDAATGLGGSYYLPYQIHATDAQFHAAYPNAQRYFALKRRVDPANKFRNKLWDAYYKPR
jgi:FAD/FMN-containing dehydrogenase